MTRPTPAAWGVCPAALGAAGSRRVRYPAGPAADCRRAAPPWHPLRGCAVRGLALHAPACGSWSSTLVRRPGDAGRSGPVADAAQRCPRRRRGRDARVAAAAALARRCRCCRRRCRGGLPESPRTGDVLDGIDEAAEMPDAYVLHAGTRRDADAGSPARRAGAVVVGTGRDVAQARARAYEAAALIRLDGSYIRTDIAPRPSAARSRPVSPWRDRSGIEKHRVARSWSYRSSRNRWRNDEHGHEAKPQASELHAADSHDLIRVQGARENNSRTSASSCRSGG